MEDVLDVYKRPYDPKRPQICCDETSKQLIEEVRVPIPAKPGRVERVDYEYKRNGTANMFMLVEPLTGQVEVRVTERRTRTDWAHVMKDLVDRLYPQADRIVMVMDNLNTHAKSSLYEAFAPEEAKRIADKLEIHYTPKHGSWLDIAECELSIMQRQCLDRRIACIDDLKREVSIWVDKRNKNPTPVNWRFTTEDARIKLKRLYPSNQS